MTPGPSTINRDTLAPDIPNAVLSQTPPSMDAIFPFSEISMTSIPAAYPVANPFLTPSQMTPNPPHRFSTLSTNLEPPTSYETPSIPPRVERLQESSDTPIQRSSQDTAALENTHTNTRVILIVGSVLGSVALLGLVGLIFRVLRRRSARNRPQLSFAAQRTNSFHESPNFTLTPIGRCGNFRASFHQIRNLGAKFGLGGTDSRKTMYKKRHHRENSQIFYRRFPQHSRDNSSLSNYVTSPTFVDRSENWFTGIREKMGFPRVLPCHRSRDLMDPCSIIEKQTYLGKRPDNPQSNYVDDQKAQLDVERGQVFAGANKYPVAGVPGFDDYFYSSVRDSHDQSYYAPIGIGDTSTPNSFTLPRPQPVTPKAMNYIADIRRSRGRSIESLNYLQDETNNVSPTGGSSRYPSMIAPIRDSYRDSVCSSVSSVINERWYKGRSDPFDLDRPELWLPQCRDDSMIPFQSHRRLSSLKDILDIDLNSNSRPSSREFIENPHTNEMFLMDWGDPGPDVGSANSDLNRIGEYPYGLDNAI